MIARALILAALVAGTCWLCLAAPEIPPGQEAGVLMDLPDKLPGFAGERGEPDPVELKLLPDDTEFAKMLYLTPTDDWSQRDVAHVSIVLSGAERRSIHRPEVCLQGQGWTVLDSRTRHAPLGDGRSLAVKDLYIEKILTLSDGTKRPLRAHYIYWFVGNDVTTPGHAERIWLTLWDNITRNVNHRWAYASVMATVTDNFTTEQLGQRLRDNEETVAMLMQLIGNLVPQVQKEFMPRET